MMGAYTKEQAMEDAGKLGRALRLGRVEMQGTELPGVLSFTGDTYRHRELLGTGLSGLYVDGEWLVDQEWLSPGQRECLEEAVRATLGP